MSSTPVYNSLVSSIAKYKSRDLYDASKTNEIMLVWNSHIKLLNKTYPGYDIKDLCPMTCNGIQFWEASNGGNWLSNFQRAETELINYKYEGAPKDIYMPKQSRRSNGPSSPAPGTKAYLITKGLLHPFTSEEVQIANASAYRLPLLTAELSSHPYVIERHRRFGYPIDEMVRDKDEAEQKERNRQAILKKELDDAYIWAANRLPGEPPLSESVIEEYRWNLKKTEKVSKLIKEYPSYTNVEVESILQYIESQNTGFSKYEKNTLLAMKALNRFAKENDIDVNSAIVVWKEYLK